MLGWMLVVWCGVGFYWRLLDVLDGGIGIWCKIGSDWIGWLDCNIICGGDGMVVVGDIIL